MQRDSQKVRVAILCDSPDEGWRSMDIVAAMLKSELEKNHAGSFRVESIADPIGQYLRLLPFKRFQSRAFAADRLIHRFWQYPKHVRSIARQFDVFHIVDHSYSALAYGLPPNRTVITCHDVHAFRSICNPDFEPRPLAFKLMTRVLLQGFKRASRIICVSEATKQELLGSKLADAGRIVVIPNGIDPVYRTDPDPVADSKASKLLGHSDSQPPLEFVNVGSTIPRKRVDVLLRIAARLKEQIESPIRLVRVGGSLTPKQWELAQSLGIKEMILCLPFIESRTLAAIYRRAAVIIQPSEAEGFGLPVLEALACGGTVIASDIAAHREVGGSAVTYCPIENIERWANTIVKLIQESALQPQVRNHRKAESTARASLFSWSLNASRTTDVYKELQQTTSTRQPLQ